MWYLCACVIWASVTCQTRFCMWHLIAGYCTGQHCCVQISLSFSVLVALLDTNRLWISFFENSGSEAVNSFSDWSLSRVFKEKMQSFMSWICIDCGGHWWMASLLWAMTSLRCPMWARGAVEQHLLHFQATACMRHPNLVLVLCLYCVVVFLCWV